MDAILALIPNWLGDVAMCTPALRVLHDRYPSAALTVAGRASGCELLEGLPWIDHYHVLPTRPGLRAMAKEGWAMRKDAHDLAVVFPHSFRAAVLARLTNARRRLGYDRNGRGFLLTDRVPPSRENGRIEPFYMAHEYLTLLKAVGCDCDSDGLELRADPMLRERLRSLLPKDRLVVGIAPGAAFGPSKRWLPEYFAKVIDILESKKNAQCVLFTGPGEDEIYKAVAEKTQTPVLQLFGMDSSIEALKAGISLLDLFIGNDSGPRHIAVAFNVPTVCIMGPTSPAYSCGPYERGKVLRVSVDCGPCQQPVCTTDHRCMTRIAPEWVADTAIELLSRDESGQAAETGVAEQTA